jgi:hypothetical protein
LVPTIPAIALAEVWRGDAKDARVARLLKACSIEAVDERLAREAGRLRRATPATQPLDPGRHFAVLRNTSTTILAVAKSAPFSLRLSEETDRLVTAEAKRTKRSKGSVVETLAEEALKTRTVPGIAFRGDDYNRRAWLIGTSLDVWQVIEAYKDFSESLDRVIAETDLSERELRTALSYYGRFPQEIDDFIALNRRPLTELHSEYPYADIIPIQLD